jgi:hypothetical protein
MLAPQAPKTKKVIAKKSEEIEQAVAPEVASSEMPVEESDELTADDLLDMETLSEASTKPAKAKKETAK